MMVPVEVSRHKGKGIFSKISIRLCRVSKQAVSGFCWGVVEEFSPTAKNGKNSDFAAVWFWRTDQWAAKNSNKR